VIYPILLINRDFDLVVTKFDAGQRKLVVYTMFGVMILWSNGWR